MTSNDYNQSGTDTPRENRNTVTCPSCRREFVGGLPVHDRVELHLLPGGAVDGTTSRPCPGSPTRSVRLFFSGTSSEFRAWLAQIIGLASGESYEWELTASIARHPAGKRLGGDGQTTWHTWSAE